MQSGMEARNLVVCCDGTGNVLGNKHDTNVVKLARLCANDARQLVFYDPGVGTASGLPSVDWLDRVQSTLTMISGLAFGRGIYENISQAYEFLVQNYRAGDRIFLFGFSRGAFTVRCVSGLVSEYGIVRPCALPLLPLMIRNYFAPHEPVERQGRAADQKRRTFNEDVRDHFTDEAGRGAEIHFLGVWDTVSSVGGVRSMGFATQPHLRGKPYRHVRHAVSDGEYRAKYLPRLYIGETRNEPQGTGKDREPSFKQLWFPGVHSDVGGSYKEAGLSDGALAWMLAELEQLGEEGLQLVPDARAQRDWPKPDPLAVAHDQALVSPLWALTGLQRRRPPTAAEQHESLRVRGHRSKLDVEPRLRFPRLMFFWWSLFACLGSYALLSLNARAIGPLSLTPFQLAMRCLSALVLPEELRLQTTLNLAAAFGSNALLCVSFGALACTFVVYAIRALREYKPGQARVHDSLRRLTMSSLWAAILGGLFESVIGYGYFSQPETVWNALPMFGVHSICAALLSLASATRWLGVLTLLGFWLFAAGFSWFGKSRPTQPAVLNSPAE